MASRSSERDGSDTETDSSTGPDPGSDSDYDGWRFSEGEKVLVKHEDCFHKAKVLELPREDDYLRKYLVRYNGWNESWDDWIDTDCVLKYTKVTYAEQLKLGKKKGFKSAMSSTVSKVKPGCPNREAVVDGLKTHLFALKGLSLLHYVEKLLEEDKSVVKDLTNDILSAISSINGDLLGKSLSTQNDWETKHKTIHEFLEKHIQYAVEVAGRRANRLSQTDAEVLATVWKLIKRYPYLTWGVDSLQDYFEEILGYHLKKLLDSDDFDSYMAELKVIRRLPTDIMELKLSSVLRKIAGHTKNPETQIVAAARLALVSCLEEFGMKYLQVVIQSLHDVWKQDSEVHELRYNVKLVLTNCMSKLSRCLEDLFAMVESRVSEDVAEEENMRRKKYTFDSLKLIAENVSLKSEALQLVSLVTAQVKELSNEKTRSVLEEILENVAAGFENNTFYDQEDQFELIYYFLRDDGIGNERSLPGMVAGFALDLLLKRLKKSNLEALNKELLDPFLGLITGCLRNQRLVSSALSVLHLLISFPLPSLTLEGDRYEGNRLLIELLSIAKSGRNIPLAVSLSLFQLLKWFISCNKIKTEQLAEVMRLPEFEDIERDQHCRALLLFEAMVEGGSMVTEIHEIASKVLDAAIKSNNEEISVRCETILLEFLVNYSTDERLFKHMASLLDKLGSDNQTETADRGIDILYAIFTGLLESGRKQFLNKHCRKLFVSLLSLMPPMVDYEQSPTGDLIQFLVNNIDRDHSGSLLVICMASFKELPAAMAKGVLFFVEIFRKNFSKHFKTIWKKMEVADTPFQQYCSLFMVEKVLNAFPQYSLRDDFEDMWKVVFGLLLRRDGRLRNTRLKLLKKFSEALKKRGEEGSAELQRLEAQVQDMTWGNSGKRRLEEVQERDFQRKRRR